MAGVDDLARYKADLTGSDPEITLVWQLKVSGLPEPVREFRFMDERKWRFDLAWPAHGLIAVEVEGGIYSAGRHSRGAGMEADMVKYNRAAELGWRVFRYSPRMIDNGEALAQLERVLK
jgi:hypothetical protein